MNVESAIITKVIDERDILPALEAKILPHFFHDKTAREVWGWILEYRSEHNDVPTEDVLARHFPDYTLEDPVKEPLSYLIEEMQEQRRYGILSGAVSTAASALKNDDTDAANAALLEALTRANVEVNTLRDVDLTENWEDRLARYEEYRELGTSMRGIPIGIPTLDRALLGLQPEQLLVWFGYDKSGKSTLLMRVMKHVHQYPARVLFMSFEMSEIEQEARWDCMLAGLNWRKLVTGRLNNKEMRRLEQAMKERENLPPAILSTDVTAGTTLGAVAAKIEQYQPKVAFIDGVYLMQPENPNVEQGSSQHLTELTRGFKRIAQRYRICVCISTQALRWKGSKSRGLTIDTIGYSSSFAQDADASIGVMEVEDEPMQRELRIANARNAAPMKGIMMDWDWEHSSFEEMTEYTHDDDGEEETQSTVGF